MPDAPTTSPQNPSAALGELPRDELLRYAVGLGLELDEDAPAGEIVQLLRRRQELLLELDREALLDIVVWARRPVRQSAGKEELAREIARIQRANYESLSTRGLVALARLRGVKADMSDEAGEIIHRLKKHDGFWKRLGRKRRAWVGSLVSHMLDTKEPGTGDYRFLPEEDAANDASRQSLKRDVEERGLVGGIAQRLRGAADDYLKQKLDEIEARIDAKMEEIDRRLGEWRDREVSNRLKILRLTLLFTVLVAGLSLGYNCIKVRVTGERPQAANTVTQPNDTTR